MNSELVGSLLQKADPAMAEWAGRSGDRMNSAGFRAFVLRIDKLGLDPKHTRRRWSLGITNRHGPAPDGLSSPDHTDASLLEIEMNAGLSIHRRHGR